MSKADRYIPILKGKLGEFWALQNLKPVTRDRITPLVEMVPPRGETPLHKQLKTTVEKLVGVWPDLPLFVDLLWLADAGPLDSGMHVVESFFERARHWGLPAIPVTSPAMNAAYQQAVKGAVATDGRGVGVRIGPALAAKPAELGAALDGLLGLLALEPGQVDIVVDYGSVISIEIVMLAQVMALNLAALPRLAQWRSVTLAGSTFPKSLTIYPQDTWTSFPRREWIAWLDVASSAQVPRRPRFGDYAVADPDIPYGGKAPISANLRYTAGPNFLIWRGHNVEDHPDGNAQMYAICANLVGRSEFMGAGFSQGDAEIAARSTSQGSPGAAREWRQWGTNHHIELAASQVASLPAP